MPRANSPISTAPRGTSPRFGWPWLARAATVEPTAMPTVNTARHMVTTPSVPPTSVLTRAGSSDSATKPTSQNQDTMCAPPHRRRSVFSSRSSASVEVQGLVVMVRPGAEGPAAGMVRAKTQDAIASARMTPTTI